VDLGYVLRRAWEITGRHKALWLFGFFVSLGAVARRIGMGSGGRWRQPGFELPPHVQRGLADFQDSPYFVVAVVLLVLLMLAIGVGLALLGALGRAAMVDQVRVAEDRGAVSLRAGWQAGERHLWGVFLIRLLLGLPMAMVALAGAFPMVGTWFLIAGQDWLEVVMPGVFSTLFALFACLFPALCLVALVSVPPGVLQRLAVRACVLEGYDVWESVVRAWAVLREHLRPLALVWLIFLAFQVGVLIVIGLLLAMIGLSLAAVALLMAFVSPQLFVALALISGLLAWLVGAAVNGVVETFVSAAWTLAYRELIGMGLTGEDGTSGDSLLHQC